MVYIKFLLLLSIKMELKYTIYNLDLHFFFRYVASFWIFYVGVSILVYYGGKLWQDLSKYKKVRMLSAKSTYIFYILDFPIDFNRVTQIYAL